MPNSSGYHSLKAGGGDGAGGAAGGGLDGAGGMRDVESSMRRNT